MNSSKPSPPFSGHCLAMASAVNPCPRRPHFSQQSLPNVPLPYNHVFTILTLEQVTSHIVPRIPPYIAYHLVIASRSTTDSITPELAESAFSVKQAMSAINKAIQELPNYSKHLYSSQSRHAHAVIESLQARFTASSRQSSNAFELLSKVSPCDSSRFLRWKQSSTKCEQRAPRQHWRALPSLPGHEDSSPRVTTNQSCRRSPIQGLAMHLKHWTLSPSKSTPPIHTFIRPEMPPFKASSRLSMNCPHCTSN